METFDDFVIRHSFSYPLSLPEDAEGKIYVIGNNVHRSEFIPNYDSQNLFYDYRYVFIKAEEETDDSSEISLVCAIRNPLSGELEYVSATANPNFPRLTVAQLINKSETILRRYYTAAVAAQASQNRENFLKAVEKTIVDDRPWDGESNIIDNVLNTERQRPSAFPDISLCNFIAFPIPLLSNTIDSDDELFSDGSGDEEWDAVPPDGSNSADIHSESLSAPVEYAPGITNPEFEEKHYLRKLSARERKLIVGALPKTVNKAMLEKNPQAKRFFEDVINNLTPREMRYIILNSAGDKGQKAFEIMRAKAGCDSKYQLDVRPATGRSIGYRGKAFYNIFIVTPSGERIPVTFPKSAAYCIYMMHIIDRYHKRGEATPIDLRLHEKDFYKVYSTIMDDITEEKIQNDYRELENYRDKGGKKMRTGRYGEHISDINTKLEDLVGMENSFAFKIGKDEFLPLNPSNIELPENLKAIKIS